MTSEPRDYRIELPVFEGPLDLLLHLVKKHELDILDIPVAFITDKYLEFLELMRQMNLEVAGEYLLMAATLVHIKSRELLPAPDPAEVDEAIEGEEELDPRQELIRRLLEYQKYKEAAQKLDDRPALGRTVFLRGSRIEDLLPDAETRDVRAPLAEVPVFTLVEILADVLAKARVQLTHEVTVERLSIADRIHQLAERLEAEGTFTFRSCFAFLDREGEIPAEQARHEVVVTFLAILEMARLKLIRLSQPDERSDIYITRAVEDVRARAQAGVVGEP